jgi:hypothetical protein
MSRGIVRCRVVTVGLLALAALAFGCHEARRKGYP